MAYDPNIVTDTNGSVLDQLRGVLPAQQPKPNIVDTISRSSVVHDMGFGDYDLSSAIASGANPDPETGHLPDTYKLPNHITFSDESQYNDGGAGHWEQIDDKWYFTPGPTNLKHHSMDDLRKYFKEHEPDSVLVEPQQAATESKLPNPFSDIGKYTPQAPTGTKPSDPALKFWDYSPKTKVIPIREGENEGREQVPLYRGGKDVTPKTPPPRPHERLQPTPEGGPKSIYGDIGKPMQVAGDTHGPLQIDVLRSQQVPAGAVPFTGSLKSSRHTTVNPIHEEGGSKIYEHQKSGRWPSYILQRPDGNMFQFRSFQKAKDAIESSLGGNVKMAGEVIPMPGPKEREERRLKDLSATRDKIQAFLRQVLTPAPTSDDKK